MCVLVFERERDREKEGGGRCTTRVLKKSEKMEEKVQPDFEAKVQKVT